MKSVYQNRLSTTPYSDLFDLGSIDIFRRTEKPIRNFNSTYFVLEASTMKIKNACKPLLSFFGISPRFFDENSLFELIVENLHPSDVYKIEEYLNFIHKQDKANYSTILKLKNSFGEWRQICVNTITDQVNMVLSSDHLYVCCTDMTELMELEQRKSSNGIVSQENDDLKLMASLSKREKEILKLVVQGYTDKEVASELNISSHTAITHRKNIIYKLKVKNTASLAFTAGRIGVF